MSIKYHNAMYVANLLMFNEIILTKPPFLIRFYKICLNFAYFYYFRNLANF